MADIFSKVFSGVASALRNPIFALVILSIVLIFPLDLIDYLIWIIIAIMAVIVNAILWIFVGIANAIISLINWLVNVVVSAINGLPGGIIDIGTPGAFDSFPYTKILFDDIKVDLFAPGTSLLTIILSLVGISVPIW